MKYIEKKFDKIHVLKNIKEITAKGKIIDII